MTIYCARDFSVEDIQTIRDLIAQDPKLQRSALSRKLCQLWGWTKPNGELKDMTCRVALLRMQADGLIELPPSRIGVVRKRAHFPSTCASDAQTPIRQPVHELPRVTLQVVSGKSTSLLWNEYVARYHFGRNAVTASVVMTTSARMSAISALRSRRTEKKSASDALSLLAWEVAMEAADVGLGAQNA